MALVSQPRGLQYQQTELAQLNPAIGDLFLNHLLLCELFAACEARQNTLAHAIKALCGFRESSHRMMHAPATETDLGDHECVASFSEHIFLRHPYVRPTNMTVNWLSFAVESVISNNFDPGRFCRNNEHRHSSMRGGVLVGNCHSDVEAGIACI